MQEAFLHYLWKFKKFNLTNLKTTQSETIFVKSVGTHNYNSGPDFFNAQIQIGSQLWAGNVEIHLKSSDWFVHNHQTDTNYDNVILHVVWQDDVAVFRKDNTKIPTLELQHFVDKSLLNNYQKLFSKQQKWINCENDFKTRDTFLLSNWLERLYFERLENKSQVINDLLQKSQNNWEAVLFKMLAKNFGLKVNSEAFLSVANSVDFSIVRKLQHNSMQLEALLFGQANLLNHDIEDFYFKTLNNEYKFLKQKFQLDSDNVVPLQFFRLRPNNFPTIRLSQLANLYHKQANLFSKVIQLQNKEAIYELFEISTSNYWKNHYTFGKVSKNSIKKLTKSFIDLVIINTIIPLKFAYSKTLAKDENESILQLIKQLKSENNTIVNKFNNLKQVANSALESQALIELKTNYCDKNKCLQCAIGNSLLSEK